MIFIDEIKSLKLYNKPFYLPINLKDKKRGSSVFLLGRNTYPDGSGYAAADILSSNPLLNKKYFESYYIEKDVTFYINNEGYVMVDKMSKVLNEDSLDKLSTVFGTASSLSMRHYKNNGTDDDPNIDKDDKGQPKLKEGEINPDDTKDNKLKADVSKSEDAEPTNPNSTDSSNDNIDTNEDDKSKLKQDSRINIWDELDKVEEKGGNKHELIFELTFKDYDNNYESPRSRNSLSKYSSIKIHDSSQFKHVRIGKNYNGKAFYDGDALVGYVNVNKDNNTIQAMEVSKEYQGTGLGSQILNFAIKNLNATNLTVNKKNKVAINMYKKSGFESYDETEYMWFMKLNNSKVVKEQVMNEFSSYEMISDFMGMIKQAKIDAYNKECQERALQNRLMLENGVISEGNFEQELVPDEFIGKIEDSLTGGFIEFVKEDCSVVLGIKSELEYMNENINSSYKNKIHNLLYNDRFKTPKEVLNQYDTVKEKNSDIKYTYLNYDKYVGKNLFIDLSFYNDSFYKNNSLTNDKAVDFYIDFIKRLILDKRLDGIYNKRTILIPLDHVIEDKRDLIYTQSINILSCIIRMINDKHPDGLWDFKGIEFLLLSNNGYMKFEPDKLTKEDIPKFESLLIKFVNKEPIVDDSNIKDSPQAIVANISDKIETSQGIKIHNLTGQSGDKNIDDIINKVSDVASKSMSEDETLDKLNDNDTDDFKNLVLKAAVTNGEVKINASRQARLNKVHEEFMNVKIKNKTVKELLSKEDENKELPTLSLNNKIDTVNEEWNDLKFVNFNTVYDINKDIVDILNSLSTKKNPIMVRDIQIEDTSTSEDMVETWTVKMEDAHGQRFSFVFELPKFKDKSSLFLRGNKKKISGQYVLIPISKTDVYTAQIVSNYKKIFIRRFGLSAPGKSYPTADLIYKTLSKNEFKGLKITPGDNTKISNKYDLPMDYIDLATIYSTIETPNTIIYFNQDEINKKYKDKIDNNKGLPFAVNKSNNNIIYWNDNVVLSDMISTQISVDIKDYKESFDLQKTSTKYHYSQASILASKIPLIVVLGYNEGLTKVLDKSKIVYNMQEKRPSINNTFEDYIKFKDGYIVYTLTYDSSLLMNGLKECNTEDYSLTEIDNPTMFLDFLDIYGGRILADGLDNFYELMIDGITEDVLERYNLPTDYVTLCLLANKLLVDNKYIAHTNPESNRYRSNELLAGYAYQCIATSYGDYKTFIKKGKTKPMTMKRTAIIDAILLDSTCGDKSVLNEIMDWEDECALSHKGLSGMNNDRSYSLDKRTYNKNMINLVAMSTGFAGNVGVNRSCTIDSNVQGKRGYLKIDHNEDQYSITKTFCPTEALTPYGTTSDDPFRSAMTFIQTGSHSMRVKKGMPNLVTNGADQAMPYFTSNTFSYNCKADGEVAELTDSYMVLRYKDGTHEFISLEEKVEKNSNGGIYITIKLDPCVKQGQKIKAKDIVAYDKLSYSNKVGDGRNPAYSGYVICKMAVMNTEEGYEDSTVISDWLSDAMASDVVIKKEVIIPKDSNILSMVKKGQPIKEGDSLMVFQNAYDQEDVNILLKNLSDDEDGISELGRIPIKSHVEGIVQDIKISRTVEIDQLSESLQKIVKAYEKPIRDKKQILSKYDIPNNGLLDADYKLDSTGKLKNVDEGLLIEIFCKYEDKLSTGDKQVAYSALKGVVKGMYPKGMEPFSEFRPDEKIHTITAVEGILARMIGSLEKVGSINKGLIELDRLVKDKLGIKWKYLEEMMEN